MMKVRNVMTTRKPRLRLLSALLAVAMLMTLLPTAAFATVEHTVTFDPNGHGTAPASVKVQDGGTITAPADPTEDGYTFKGWYTDPWCADDKAFDFGNAITGNTTLYAKWSYDKPLDLDENGWPVGSNGGTTYIEGRADGSKWKYVIEDNAYTYLYLTNGTFDFTDKPQVLGEDTTNRSVTVWPDEGADVTIKGGNFGNMSMRGGTIENATVNGYLHLLKTNIIENGTFNGQVYAFPAHQSTTIKNGIFKSGRQLNVTGGTVNIEGGVFDREVVVWGGTLNISGGVFSAEPVNDAIADGSQKHLVKFDVDSAILRGLKVNDVITGKSKLWTVGEQKLTLTTNMECKWRVISDNATLSTEELTKEVVFNVEGDRNVSLQAKRHLTVGDFDFIPPDDLKYNGQPKEAELILNDENYEVGCGAMTATYYDENNKLIKASTKPGKYTVKLSVAENDRYFAAKDLTDKNWTFTITKGDTTVDMFDFTKPSEASYDGTKREASVQPKSGYDTGEIGKVTVKYYKDGDTVGTTDAPTAPGTYVVKIDVDDTGTLYGSAKELTADDWTFTIGKAGLKANMFQFAAPDDLIYNGQPKEATVTVKSEYIGKVGEITDIRYCKVGTGEKVVDADGKPTAPVDVGSYYVLLFAEAGTHYTNAPGWHVYNWSFNILPADLTTDDFELANGTVNLKDTVKGAGTVKRQYKLLDENGKPTGEYLDELPTDEGGVYQIYVTAESGKNYNALLDPVTKKEWTITVDGKDRDLKGDGFTATVDGKETDTAKWGQTVEIEPSDIPTGKKFDHWEISDATLEQDADQPKNSFVMGNSDVTITPKYEDIKYTLTVDGKDEFHIYGEEIKVSAPKKDGYKFTGWDISGVDVADKTSEDLNFKMPAGNVTLTPQYDKIETPEQPNQPETPSDPDKPSTPETPDKPGEPDTPNTPDTPETPDQPSEPEEPKPVTYTIVIDNGTAYGEDGETAINTAEAGQTVTIKVNPEAITEGFEFDQWEIVSGEVTLTDETAPETTFEMPASDVELKATVKAIEPAVAPLTGIEKAAIVSTGTVVVGAGVAAVGFAAYGIGVELTARLMLPAGVAMPTTRGELAVVLWKKAGSPAVPMEAPLSETEIALRWAADNQLVEPDAAPEERVSALDVVKALKPSQSR